MKLKPKIKAFLSHLSMIEFILVLSTNDFNFGGLCLFIALIMALCFNLWILENYG